MKRAPSMLRSEPLTHGLVLPALLLIFSATASLGRELDFTSLRQQIENNQGVDALTAGSEYTEGPDSFFEGTLEDASDFSPGPGLDEIAVLAPLLAPASSTGDQELSGQLLAENSLASKHWKSKHKPPTSSTKPAASCSSFWATTFRKVVTSNLGGISMDSCFGAPDAGGYKRNLQLASSVKGELLQGNGSCNLNIEVLVWNGMHGHDHQGANVLTAQASKKCDGGMSGVLPGSLCSSTGGTFHRFCTGRGKSYSLFFHPKGARTKNFDIETFAHNCGTNVNLLITFTECLESQGKKQGLRGVIVIPFDGTPDPNNKKKIRHNNHATTFHCAPTGWLWCKRITVNGRDIKIFAVQPLA